MFITSLTMKNFMVNKYYTLCTNCVIENYITNPKLGEIVTCNDCSTQAVIVKIMDIKTFKQTCNELLESDFKDRIAYLKNLLNDSEDLNDDLGLVILRPNIGDLIVK